MTGRIRRPSPSLAISLIALFVAVGGTTYAATSIDTDDLASRAVTAKKIAKEAVKRAKIRRDAVDSSRVRNASLLAEDFAPNQLPSGEQGPAGVQGPPGEPATRLWAVVNSGGTLLRGTGVVSASQAPGGFEVIFNRDVAGCSYSATLGAVQAEVGQVGVGPRNGNPNGVFVFTSDSTGADTPRGFNLQVFC